MDKAVRLSTVVGTTRSYANLRKWSVCSVKIMGGLYAELEGDWDSRS